MSLLSDEQPHLLIIAGPNGSGKSSAYQRSVAEADGRAFRIINPDLFAKRIADSEGIDLKAANLEAVQRIEVWLETSILAGHTIGVETVLSTDKYRRLATMAKKAGYIFYLIYVILDDPRKNVERVQIRVKSGGHYVDSSDVVRRYWKSLAQLPWFLDQADRAWLWDNSGARLKPLGEKVDGVITLDSDAFPAVISALQSEPPAL